MNPVKKKKGGAMIPWSKETKAAARVIWETESVSAEEIAKRLTTKARKLDKTTVQQWCHRGKWQKRQLASYSADMARGVAVRKLIEGQAPEKVAEKALQMLEATRAVLAMDGSEVDSKCIDWSAVKGAIQEINKMMGLYAPVKSEVDIQVSIKAMATHVVTVVGRYLDRWNVPAADRAAFVEDLNAGQPQ